MQCQLDTLADSETPQEIRYTLQNVPSTLEQTYRNILARIPRKNTQRAKRALFWLSFSLRPITFVELCEAVIIPEDSSIISEDMRLLRPEVLLKICSSLISYDSTTTKVALAHSSVWQYLVSQEIQISDVQQFFLNEDVADADMAVRCLRYLCLPAFSSGYCSSNEELTQRLEEWPLLHHITQTIFDHLSYTPLDGSVKTLLLHFFQTQIQPRGGNFGAWVQVFFPTAHANIESSTPLYYAARFGLLPVVKMILEIEGTRNLETPGGVYGSTPLHVATWQGRTEVVQELLKAGANAREVNEERTPGLFFAVLYGFKDIERMLREAGARFDADITFGDLDDESDEDEIMTAIREEAKLWPGPG